MSLRSVISSISRQTLEIKMSIYISWQADTTVLSISTTTCDPVPPPPKRRCHQTASLSIIIWRTHNVNFKVGNSRVVSGREEHQLIHHQPHKHWCACHHHHHHHHHRLLTNTSHLQTLKHSYKLTQTHLPSHFHFLSLSLSLVPSSTH